MEYVKSIMRGTIIIWEHTLKTTVLSNEEYHLEVIEKSEVRVIKSICPLQSFAIPSNHINVNT